ncbi:MAG: prohibitin family protein [Chitinophagaceae bacterium]|nr:prohibitin family protein [Chitinophagaceae bacterium]
MENKRFLPVVVILSVTIIFFIYFSSQIFFTIQPGEVGLIFHKFTGGLDKTNLLKPGFHTKAPWNVLYVYDITENQKEETMDVLDKNGLAINVDISVRFHPMPDKIGDLQETFRQDYVTRLVVPEVRSTVRQVMGRYTSEEIYSTKRQEVENTIRIETAEVLGKPGNNILMKALLIRSIKLPEQISLAIENKLKQEQEALAYQFRLDRERSEAERKRIGAEGEAKANAIINSSLTPSLLKMRGIEATQDLAKSSNTKIIVIGGGKDGLPLILNTNDN